MFSDEKTEIATMTLHVGLINIYINFLVFCLGYKSFQNRIPNGNHVPHPCHQNKIWQGLGHQHHLGGGALNQFGKDFLANRKVSFV